MASVGAKLGYVADGKGFRRTHISDSLLIILWEMNSHSVWAFPHRCVERRDFSKMVIIFQLALLALVLLSFVMVVGVPVAYASPQNWEQSKRLILLGSVVWGILVVVVGSLNYLVV